jgi:hypothetical protein
MCFDELVETIARNVSRLLYVRLHADEGNIVYALSDVPELVCAHVENRDELKKTWDALTRLLTTMCQPAFVQLGAHLLFQPEFVSGLGRHADARAYFVIVFFPGKHNLALGSLTMGEREERFLVFCELLGLHPQNGSPPPTIQ